MADTNIKTLSVNIVTDTGEDVQVEVDVEDGSLLTSASTQEGAQLGMKVSSVLKESLFTENDSSDDDTASNDDSGDYLFSRPDGVKSNPTRRSPEDIANRFVKDVRSIMHAMEEQSEHERPNPSAEQEDKREKNGIPNRESLKTEFSKAKEAVASEVNNVSGVFREIYQQIPKGRVRRYNVVDDNDNVVGKGYELKFSRRFDEENERTPGCTCSEDCRKSCDNC